MGIHTLYFCERSGGITKPFCAALCWVIRRDYYDSEPWLLYKYLMFPGTCIIWTIYTKPSHFIFYYWCLPIVQMINLEDVSAGPKVL